MDDRLGRLLRQVKLGPPPTNVAPLIETAAGHSIELAADYVEFVTQHDGGEGDVGSVWLQLWTIDRICSTADADVSPYEGVLLFAGDGANTIYGFDSTNANGLIEGDWVGLGHDEVVPRGDTFVSFLESLASAS